MTVEPTSPPTHSLKFGKERRLLRRKDFQAVYGGGKSARRKGFTLFALPLEKLPEDLSPVRRKDSEEFPTRIGLTASRKCGNAVLRNRARRRVREVFRLLQHQIRPGFALVANLNRQTAQLPLRDLMGQFQSILRELDLWIAKPLPVIPTTPDENRATGDPVSGLPAPSDSQDHQAISVAPKEEDPALFQCGNPSLAGRLAISVLRGYKAHISPLLPPLCRYEPTCSIYAMEAFQRKPFPVAVGLTLWRLCRCNPWSRGGYDPVE